MNFGRLFICLLLASSSLSWADYFRYYDNTGTVVINSWVPPEYAGNGYTVLDEAGNVLRVVEPVELEAKLVSMTPEEREALEARQHDAHLMSIYRSAGDVERAKDTVLGRIELEATFVSNRMLKRESELYDLQAQAAEDERARRPINEKLMAQIAEMEAEIKILRDQLNEIKAKRQATIVSFDRDKERVAYIVERREQLLDSIMAKRLAGEAIDDAELEEFLQLQFKDLK